MECIGNYYYYFSGNIVGLYRNDVDTEHHCNREYLQEFHSSFVITVVAFFVLMIPRYIQMGDTSLVLKKVCGRVVICYNQILEIEPYKLSGDVRVFGSGGFGGFLGLFFNPKKGKYFAYVTHPAHIVFITTKNGKKYAFSCSNAELLVETIKKLENENIHL